MMRLGFFSLGAPSQGCRSRTNERDVMTTITLDQKEDGKFVCPAQLCIRCGEPATNSQIITYHRGSPWAVLLKGRLLADTGPNAVLVRVPFCKRHRFYSIFLLTPTAYFTAGVLTLGIGILLGGLVLLFAHAREDIIMGVVTLIIALTLGPWFLRRKPRSSLWPQEITATSITLSGVCQAFAEKMRAAAAPAAFQPPTEQTIPPAPACSSGALGGGDMRMVTFDCPRCRTKLFFEQIAPGAQVKCSGCGEIVAAPEQTQLREAVIPSMHSTLQTTPPVPAYQKKLSFGVVSAWCAGLAVVCFMIAHQDKSPLWGISVALLFPLFIVGPGFSIAALIRKDQPALGGISLGVWVVLLFIFLSKFQR